MFTLHPLKVTIRHWLPILTYCPVNNLPDLVYVSLSFCGEKIPELYAVRREVRKMISGKKLFMEDLATIIHSNYPEATEVQVRLAFNRHVVSSMRGAF